MPIYFSCSYETLTGKSHENLIFILIENEQKRYQTVKSNWPENTTLEKKGEGRIQEERNTWTADLELNLEVKNQNPEGETCLFVWWDKMGRQVVFIRTREGGCLGDDPRRMFWRGLRTVVFKLDGWDYKICGDADRWRGVFKIRASLGWCWDLNRRGEEKRICVFLSVIWIQVQVRFWRVLFNFSWFCLRGRWCLWIENQFGGLNIINSAIRGWRNLSIIVIKFNLELIWLRDWVQIL